MRAFHLIAAYNNDTLRYQIVFNEQQPFQVHIAAHGNSEHGEIALAPKSTQKYISRTEYEKHHMLKIADVQAVQLRALVKDNFSMFI